MLKDKVVAIVGATSSGKTSLGVALAKKFNGELISADSRQVYRGLDIGSGKEGLAADGARWIDEIPQWMIDICDPEERFTLFDFLAMAQKITKKIAQKGNVPIIVGGTGLYVKAFAEGYKHKKSNLSLDPKFSKEKLESLDLKQLQNIAGELKVELNQSDQVNKRRLVAAIMRSQSGFASAKNKPQYETLLVAIDMDREELYRRIDKRVEVRFEHGMLEEVEGLIASGIDTNWLLTLGLEYKYITQFILDRKKNPDQEKKLFDAMKQVLKYKTHGYARRQLVWWRREPVCWVKDESDAIEAVKKFLAS